MNTKKPRRRDAIGAFYPLSFNVLNVNETRYLHNHEKH